MSQPCQPLIIIKPETITDEILVFSNVPEDDYPEYDNEKVYSLGERVIDPITHRIWESFDDENVGNTPWESPVKWGSPGFTNRWRVFDDKISTKTLHPNEIKYRFRLGKVVTGLAILGLTEAFNATIRVISDDFGEVYNETKSLRPLPNASRWWAWYFSPRLAQTQEVILDLPSYPNSEIEVTINGTADLGVGMLLLGTPRNFGRGVNYGARAGLLTYSKVTRDESTGEVDLLKRPTARRSSFTVTVENREFNEMYNFMTEIESVPVFLSASNEIESLSGFGIVKNFEGTFSNYSETDCSVEFEGFI